MMDKNCCCVNHGVKGFEEAIESLPIDDDIKKKIIDRVKQARDYSSALSRELSRRQMEIDELKSTIVRLAMMISD